MSTTAQGNYAWSHFELKTLDKRGDALKRIECWSLKMSSVGGFMPHTRFALGMISSMSVMILHTNVLYGQDYPSRPIRIITGSVTNAAGLASRIIAQGITGPLGQQVIVDNRSGIVVSGEMLAKAAPDGYTVLINGSYWIPPLV